MCLQVVWISLDLGLAYLITLVWKDKYRRKTRAQENIYFSELQSFLMAARAENI